ncbi:uncharacterized protein LOC128896575, partial [Hylaeus anthracinus]|uniref:uncharacterized protein LOC128896575 n=1 Tax=Hylaeus anthracinus TaxID=313031 RepID=UPI0023B9A59A
MKLMLLNDGKIEHVNGLFSSRDDKGEFKMLFQELWEQPEKFFEYFRMRPAAFEYILKEIEERITKFSNVHVCISAKQRLAVILRFLSNGMSFRVLSFSYKISHCAIRNMVYETCQAIWECFCGIHMSLPTTEEWKTIASDFYNKWNFTNCIGCIDGKHIRMKCPKQTGSIYYNYKGFYSIVLQGIANANYKFIAIEVGAYAPFVLLGNDAYPLKRYLLKPYSRQRLTAEEKIFNY